MFIQWLNESIIQSLAKIVIIILPSFIFRFKFFLICKIIKFSFVFIWEFNFSSFVKILSIENGNLEIAQESWPNYINFSPEMKLWEFTLHFRYASDQKCMHVLKLQLPIFNFNWILHRVFFIWFKYNSYTTHLLENKIFVIKLHKMIQNWKSFFFSIHSYTVFKK